jgi:hypothetical protein
VVGYLFFHLPPAIDLVLVIRGKGGVVKVSIGICIKIPFD